MCHIAIFGDVVSIKFVKLFVFQAERKIATLYALSIMIMHAIYHQQHCFYKVLSCFQILVRIFLLKWKDVRM